MASITNLWQLINTVFFTYPSESRKGYILSFTTFACAVIALLFQILSFVSGPRIADDASSTIAIIFFMVCYALARQGYFHVASIVTIATIFWLGGQAPILIAMAMLACVIVLSGILIDPVFVFIVAAMAATLTGYSIQTGFETGLSNDIIFPITFFYELLAFITYFLLQQQHKALHQVVVTMESLAESKQTLEAEIANRTIELETSLDIIDKFGHIVLASNDLDSLLKRTVNLIHVALEINRVDIFSYDQVNNKLKQSYSSLDMNRNVVEDDCLQMVISTRRRLLATQNSGENEQTRMVLPLKKGVELIGILDILCDSSEIFTESTISLMEVLSNQLTVAIVNIQSMAETQIALEQVEALNRRLIRQQWAQTLKAKVTSGYVYTPQKSEPSVDEWLPGMELALHENQSTGRVLGEDVAIPLKLRGEVIGVLGLERDSGRLWDEDEILILQTIAEQISLALESARLFEDTQRNAWRDQVISESTAKVWASTQIEDVMKAAVAQLGTKLQASEVVIQLSSDYGVENS